MAPKKGQRGAPARGRSAESRFTILLEEIQSQNKATIEAVLGMEKRILDKLEPRLARIELRLDALEMAVRKNSEDIRKNSEDIAELQRQVARLANILGADERENAIQALERRVRVLEQHVGIASSP